MISNRSDLCLFFLRILNRFNFISLFIFHLISLTLCLYFSIFFFNIIHHIFTSTFSVFYLSIGWGEIGVWGEHFPFKHVASSFGRTYALKLKSFKQTQLIHIIIYLSSNFTYFLFISYRIFFLNITHYIFISRLLFFIYRLDGVKLVCGRTFSIQACRITRPSTYHINFQFLIRRIQRIKYSQDTRTRQKRKVDSNPVGKQKSPLILSTTQPSTLCLVTQKCSHLSLPHFVKVALARVLQICHEDTSKHLLTIGIRICG